MNTNKILRFLQELILWFFVLRYKAGFNLRKFTPGISGARSIIFLLPDSEEVCKAIVPMVQQIMQKKIAVTVVVHSKCRMHFSGIHNLQYIEYFPLDYTILGYPKKAFREKMHFAEADTLIACNFSGEIFLHICALLLKCRVKIGIKGKLTDKIYQMQFVPTSNYLPDSIKSLGVYCQIL